MGFPPLFRPVLLAFHVGVPSVLPSVLFVLRISLNLRDVHLVVHRTPLKFS